MQTDLINFKLTVSSLGDNLKYWAWSHFQVDKPATMFQICVHFKGGCFQVLADYEAIAVVPVHSHVFQFASSMLEGVKEVVTCADSCVRVNTAPTSRFLYFLKS